MCHRLAAILLLMASFSSPAQHPGLSSVEKVAASQVGAETIREVTTTLASREIKGRGMAPPGGARAAKYLADKLVFEPARDFLGTDLKKLASTIITRRNDNSLHLQRSQLVIICLASFLGWKNTCGLNLDVT